ncbi:hypothetical protein Misp01_62840 [Microtetraspora sp. NBRC 13810]|nr:hypothetical protein Misp01_62840 [Microtetraspora sp. NBRC 13810]
MLVAVAAAPPSGQLGDQRGRVEADAHAEHDVEVLERDRGHVPRVQPAQRLHGGAQRAVVADPPEIGQEVEGVVGVRHGVHAGRAPGTPASRVHGTCRGISDTHT